MHLHTVSESRAIFQRTFNRAERKFRCVSGRLSRKSEASLGPGATGPWPDSRDYEKYLAASSDLRLASEALSEHCRNHRLP